MPEPPTKANGEKCEKSSQCITGLCIRGSAGKANIGPVSGSSGANEEKICIESVTWGSNAIVGGPDTLEPYNIRATWLGYGWETLAIISLFINAFLIAILYMIYVFASHASLKNLLYSNAYHLIASALIVFLVIIFVPFFMTSFSDVFVKPVYDMVDAEPASYNQVGGASTYPSPFGLSYSFLNSMLYCSKSIYVYLYSFYWVVSTISHLTVSQIGIEAQNPFFALTSITTLTEMLLNNLNFVLAAIYFIRNLLFFSDLTMLNIFLPLGIILRITPITRGYGNVMIAFAIGFYFIFPTSFAMLIPLSSADFKNNDICTGREGLERLCDDTSSLVRAKFAIERDMGSIQWYLSLAQESIANYYYIAVYYFLIAFVITVSFIRSFSMLLGAQVAEMSRGLVKLL